MRENRTAGLTIDDRTACNEVSVRNALGRLLREWRTARQWSLDQLAARAGVAKSTVSTWENGTHQPCLAELAACPYLARHPLPVPVVADPSLTAYRALDLGRTSWWTLLRPAVIGRYLRQMVQGWLPEKPNEGEDLLQLGGDFVLDAQQRLAYIYRSTEPTETMPPPAAAKEDFSLMSGSCAKWPICIMKMGIHRKRLLRQSFVPGRL